MEKDKCLMVDIDGLLMMICEDHVLKNYESAEELLIDGSLIIGYKK